MRIIFSDECVKLLEHCFEQGPLLDLDGLRSLTEERVDKIGGLSIEIYSNEHPPPHFCVKYNGDSANFTIDSCKKINGDLNKFDKNIRKWHSENKQRLIDFWNSKRPTNCQVGRI